MSKILVIVESPGKIKKIEEFLNSLKNGSYIVKASYGHCRDLNPKELSIDVDKNFEPNYNIIPGKEKVVRELRGLMKDCSKVILAADEDREGEMIAASLKDLLNLKEYDRIVFHEITKTAIKHAIENPTTINYDMVYAQQARRLLDRLVGYKISPILWKKMQGQLSAGRVQSVVVKIIVDKENEIKDSVSNPYFKTSANFEY
jgi:DNA topoisomerase-1